MAENRKSYEGMFLVEAGNSDFQAASDPVRGILTRYGAEILSMKPWDERKLAYEIGGRKRALYILTYFKADAVRIVEVEHDCKLDERVIRQLILRRDRLTDDVINAETPATSGVRLPEIIPGEAAPAAIESPAIDVFVPGIDEAIEQPTDVDPEKL